MTVINLLATVGWIEERALYDIDARMPYLYSRLRAPVPSAVLPGTFGQETRSDEEESSSEEGDSSEGEDSAEE